MADIEDIDESDCCGNGCANCVLDIPKKKPVVTNKTQQQNILTNYTPFRLLAKTRHNSSSRIINVWELHFKSCRCRESECSDFILDISPGYHLMVRRRQTDAGENVEYDPPIGHKEGELKRKYLLRPYSPYWWDVMEMEFKILVNLKLKGPMSNFLRELQIGDEVEFRGPIGQFEHVIDSKGDNMLLIITQGVAVAPVIPIIESILHNDDDLTRIIHLTCFENVEHIYFRNRLYDFQKYWNYKVHIYLAHELCGNKECITNSTCLETCSTFKSKFKYKENLHPFRLGEEELEAIVCPLKMQIENISAILAGTGRFQNNFKVLLSSDTIGIKEENVYLL